MIFNPLKRGLKGDQEGHLKKLLKGIAQWTTSPIIRFLIEPNGKM